MTERIVTLVLANAWLVAFGAGLLPLLRLARTPSQLLVRLPLAYAVGLAAWGVLAAELALAHVAAGWIVLVVVTFVSLALGLRRLEWAPFRRPRLARELPALALLGVAAAFVVQAARLFAVKPLSELDGWAIWGLRAHSLYESGHPVAPVFTSNPYAGLPYPLWLPALEASDFRFMGAFDSTLVHLQLLGLAIAFVGGAFVLLRPGAMPLVLAAALLAVLTAPAFFGQLETNFADVPLAMLVALGVAALAAWLRRGEPGLLPAAALFLAAAALTKNEGELFVLSAFVAAALAARRAQRRPLALAAAAVLALDLPWHLWIRVHHVPVSVFPISRVVQPSYLSAHDDRVGPVVRELLFQLRSVQSWSLVGMLAVVGLAAALILRRFRLVSFALVWLCLSFAGLVAVYWVSPYPLANHLYNSSDRTIDSLLVGAALLVPVLLGRDPAAPREALAAPVPPGAA